jgi:hypothetical protein
MKSICVSLILISSVTGAAAGEYYIVQDVSTRHCTIVEMPPTTTQFVVLANGKVFSGRDEVNEVLASLSSCSSKTVSIPANPSGHDQAGKSKGRTASHAAAGTAHPQSTKARPASTQSQSARLRAARAQPDPRTSRAAVAQAQSVGSTRSFSSFFPLFR